MNKDTKDCICWAGIFEHFAHSVLYRHCLYWIDTHMDLEIFILHMENNWVRERRSGVCLCEHLHRSPVQVENLHHVATQYIFISVCFALFFKMGVFMVGNQRLWKILRMLRNAKLLNKNPPM